METPLSPNWPAQWTAIFGLILSPLKALVLPKVPAVWRVTAAAILCYGFTAVAAQFTPLEWSEVFPQGLVLLGMIYTTYSFARSKEGTATAGLIGIAGIGGSAALAWIAAPVLAQDASGLGEIAKQTGKAQLAWWIAWTCSTIGGWLGRKLDGVIK